MQLYSMDSILVDIYNIKNLELVKIYDLVMTNTKDSMIIPALLIRYDNGKTLNLCSKDKYFNTYVKKVIQVYNNEKNNIFEDSLTDPFKMRSKIDIDSYSEKIIESGILENIDEIYRFYDNNSYYEGSLLFQKDEVSLLIPIVKYHLQKLFSNTDIVLNFNEEFTGYRNNYVITGMLNGIPTDFLFMYDKINDNEYLFNIGGLLDKINPVVIKIKFDKDKIEVIISIKQYNITSNFTYLINNDVVEYINNVKKDGLTIYYVNTDLDGCSNDLLNIANIDRESNFDWFKLPWNAYYGINNKIIDLNDSEKIIEVSNMYMYSDKETFMRKEYFSKSYKKNNSEIIYLDDLIKNMMCIYLDSNIYLIETTFLDTLHVNGYYEEKLKNKYYYHLVDSKNGIKEIVGNKLISISKDDEIIEKGDVLNNELILKLVRGK